MLVMISSLSSHTTCHLGRLTREGRDQDQTHTKVLSIPNSTRTPQGEYNSQSFSKCFSNPITAMHICFDIVKIFQTSKKTTCTNYRTVCLLTQTLAMAFVRSAYINPQDIELAFRARSCYMSD